MNFEKDIFDLVFLTKSKNIDEDIFGHGLFEFGALSLVFLFAVLIRKSLGEGRHGVG